jgi:hypothetical protein
MVFRESGKLARTTMLCDHSEHEITLDEVERSGI